MDLLQYIIDEALIIIPALWIIGVFLKKTPRFADWAIVWVLLFLGVLFTVGILGISVSAIIQGVLVAGAAVLGHQLVKQSREEIEWRNEKHRPEITD